MKRPAAWLASFLFLSTVAFLAYRIFWLDYPLFPTAPGQTWQLGINARVIPDGGEIKFVLGLPTENAGRMLVEERVASGSLSFNLFREGVNRVGIWSGAADPAGEEVSYRATILVRPRLSPEAQPSGLEPYPGAFEKEDLALAERLAKRWRGLSRPARLRAVAGTSKGEWKSPPPDMRDLQAWKVLGEKHGRLPTLLLLLRAAEIPARVNQGIRLAEGIRTAPVLWIEAWAGPRREILNPQTGEMDRDPPSLLPLATGHSNAASISGGSISDLRWTVHRQVVSQWRLHFERIRRSDRFLDRWSLFRLPREFQETFRILLLVPIGALIMGALRNIIGFPTFGIFMPVLMALAFRSTGLAFGLGIFGGILFLGYGVRRALDRLRLLLVPRMSVILTLVIASFTVLALVGNRLGMREFMAVGLLPFVILTMVIERFFVLIEEAGVGAGLRTAAGSAAVSVIAYGIISWEPLQLTFFVYPELLAVVAAAQVLLGRYTGYRLSEIFRFRDFRGSR